MWWISPQVTQGYATYDTYTIIYENNGDILVFGHNYYGQLGLGHNNNINVPTLLMNDKSIKNIICGRHHPGYPRLRDLRYLYDNI